MSTLWVVIAGCIGGALINQFYAFSQTRWPNNYYATSSVVDEGVSRNILRYALFRLLPPYVMGVLIASFALRYKLSLVWTLLICGAVHLGWTIGRALYRAIRGNGMPLRLIFAHATVLAASTLSLWASGITAQWWYPLMPGPDKYVEVALTGMVAAGLIHQMQRMTGKHVDVTSVVDDFVAKFDESLMNHLKAECLRHQVEIELMLAIVITEDKQRPRWFRTLERALGRFGFKGTFGIAQSSSDWRETDEQSMSKAIKAMAGAQVRRSHHWPSDPHLRFQLERHNRSDTFVDFAGEVYRNLVGRHVGTSRQSGADGRPCVRVEKFERDRDEWVVYGDVADQALVVIAFDKKLTQSAGLTVVDKTKAVHGRVSWIIRASIDLDELLIVATPSDVDGQEGGLAYVNVHPY